VITSVQVDSTVGNGGVCFKFYYGVANVVLIVYSCLSVFMQLIFLERFRRRAQTQASENTSYWSSNDISFIVHENDV